jgi:putative hydrolase
VADDPQTGGDPEGRDPFAQFGLPFDISGIDLNEAMRILQSPGPLNWEIARQTAEQVALERDDDGRADESISDASRSDLTELARAAVGPVVTETGLEDVLSLPVDVIDRRTWARRHLDGLRPVLETLATTMQDSLAADLDAADDEDVQELTSDMLGMPMGAAGMRGLMGMLGPLLRAQTGSMIGYLAQYALGAYDLPLPSVDAPRITFVAPNIDRFADAWSLDPREVRMAVAITETVRAAQRTRPWVRERLVQIARDYVGAFALDPHAFDDAFGDLDPTDTEAMARMAQRPEVLLGALRNDTQREILERNQQFTMVLEGHADLVTDEIAAKLLPDAPRIAEALRRHHVERGEAGRFVEGMLGVELDREHYERGHEFCAGVVERAGMPGLNRLLESPERLPTPSELGAPGLWLARIDLPD